MLQSILKWQAPRMALMSLLDSLTQKIIYIHAPAGFGKTTAAQLWLQQKEATEKIIWHTLDERGNITFPDEKPYTLVLDDLHIIKNHEVLECLPTLLKQLPENCTVLILSRTAPPNSFSEMILNGTVAVIDGEHLKFSFGEIKNLFAKNGKTITVKQADEIFTSTGGWAVGINALLLSQENSYNINLTKQYLAHYFKTQVLEHCDADMKRFMSLVSVAKELTPELCERLTSKGNFAKFTPCEILPKLARENLFLRKSSENTYRFSDLFRDFLLGTLEEGDEQTLLSQYNKAGDYYFEKKDYFNAAECYLKGKNDNGVANTFYLMYDYNSASASIEDTLCTIRKSITAPLIEKHPFLLEVRTWAAYAEGRAEDFENYLDKYYTLFPEIVVKIPRAMITFFLLKFIDYRESLISVAGKCLPLNDIIDIKAFTPSITNNQPFFHRSARDFSELVEPYAQAEKADDRERALDNPQRGIEILEKAIGAVVGAEFAVIRECLYAGIYYERENKTCACEHALAACSNISEGCSAEIRFCAMMILSASLCADGQSAQAEKVLVRIEEMLEKDKAFYLTNSLRAYSFKRKIANGDNDAAHEWLEENDGSICDNLALFKSNQHFTTARALIVTGDYNHALLFIKKLLQMSERYRRTLDIIEANILLSIAYWKKGRGGQTHSVESLERAVCVAYKYGYTRLFADEGAELVNILHKLQKRMAQTAKDDCETKALRVFVKSLYIRAVEVAENSNKLIISKKPEIPNFTEKQKTVMRLLCEGYSRNEIAAKIGLKPNGVKSHTNLIYRKLKVSNNVQAVLKIRQIGFFD